MRVWKMSVENKIENEGTEFTLSRPVHTTPEEVENGGITLKTRQMFSVHTSPEEFENATITGHFGFVFEENQGKEIT